MSLQRNLKALGTFGYMTTSRNNTVYIQYMPRTLAHVKANLAKYPRFERLRRPARTLVVTVFGVSTHLYVAERLDRDHLVEIAAHGFEAIEVFALRDHFDYRDRRAAVALAEWLDDTRLRLHSMHAPIAGSYAGGAWQGGLSLAAADEPRRKAAVAETLATLDVAAAVPYQFLVVHCGVPDPHAGPGDNHRGSLVRSLEELSPVAQRFGVQLAHRSDSQPAVDAVGAGRADRKRHRCRAGDLHGCRPRAVAGRGRRRDRNLLGPPDHHAPARQPRTPRRSPRARQGRDRLGRRHAWRSRRSATTAPGCSSWRWPPNAGRSSSRPRRRANG